MGLIPNHVPQLDTSPPAGINDEGGGQWRLIQVRWRALGMGDNGYNFLL